MVRDVLNNLIIKERQKKKIDSCVDIETRYVSGSLSGGGGGGGSAKLVFALLRTGSGLEGSGFGARVGGGGGWRGCAVVAARANLAFGVGSSTEGGGGGGGRLMENKKKEKKACIAFVTTDIFYM